MLAHAGLGAQSRSGTCHFTAAHDFFTLGDISQAGSCELRAGYFQMGTIVANSLYNAKRYWTHLG